MQRLRCWLPSPPPDLLETYTQRQYSRVQTHTQVKTHTNRLQKACLQVTLDWQHTCSQGEITWFIVSCIMPNFADLLTGMNISSLLCFSRKLGDLDNWLFTMLWGLFGLRPKINVRGTKNFKASLHKELSRHVMRSYFPASSAMRNNTIPIVSHYHFLSLLWYLAASCVVAFKSSFCNQDIILWEIKELLNLRLNHLFD